MDKTYHLDLLTLVESLHRQSASLNTDFPMGIPGIFEPCTGHVRIKNGNITTCVIKGLNSGYRMNGEDALEFLRSIEDWCVTLEQDKIESLPKPLGASDSGSNYFSAPQQTSPIRPPLQSSPSWTRESTQPTQPVPATSIYIPQQRIQLLPAHVEGRPAKERMILRMVLAMVNGTRSVEQIKADLRLSPEVVDQALESLRWLRIID